MSTTCEQVLAGIRQSLPDFATPTDGADCPTQLHRLFDRYAAYTRQFIHPGQPGSPRLAECLRVADKLYTTGPSEVRQAIEASYLYALHLDADTALLRWVGTQLSPDLLRYLRQLQQAPMLP